MNFADLTWLLIGAGVFATGLGLVIAAWNMPAFVNALYTLADAIRGRARDHEEW